MTDFPITSAFATPNYTTQSGTAYPLRIDAALAALGVLAAAFQPVLGGGWTVNIGAAVIPTDSGVTTVAAQTVTVSGAPPSGLRIDRIVIDRVTGEATVLTGTAGDTPIAPIIPSGKLPCARLTIPAGAPALTNAMGVDERTMGGFGAPLPATANPIVDGTVSVGTSAKYAREDHRHPTDTTRAALASPTFTGTPRGPTASQGTNTTQLATTAYVQTEIGAIPSPFPSQTGNAGKFLTTNGTTPSWGDVTSIPAAGSVGSLAFVGKSGTCGYGSTYAGTLLYPAGLYGNDFEAAAVTKSGSALTGTWRCLGSSGSVSGATLWVHTLYVRIA